MSARDQMSNFSLQAVSALGTAQGESPRVIVERDGLRIVEEPFLFAASLRLSRSADLQAAISRLATALPIAQAPNQFAGDANLSCARHEPNAWIVLATAPCALPSDAAWVATDISARLASFRLSGAGVADVLAAGTSVRPAASGFVRTLLAETATVLAQRLSDSQLRVLIDASLAHWLADWFADSAQLIAQGATA